MSLLHQKWQHRQWMILATLILTACQQRLCECLSIPSSLRPVHVTPPPYFVQTRKTGPFGAIDSFEPWHSTPRERAQLSHASRHRNVRLHYRQPVVLFASRKGDSRDDNGERISKTKEKEQTTGEVILSLAIPALAGLAIDPLMTLADTAFVGRCATSPAELAGIGSASAVLTFSFYVFNFLCTATTPLVALRRASGDERGAMSVGGQALSLALGLGILLCVGLTLLSSQLLQVMGTGITGQDANAYATSFLMIRSLAAPAVFVSSAATGVLRGYLDTKTPIVVLVGANVVNFLLDVLLIPGAGLGPTGAAIATTTAEWIAAVSFLGVLAGKLPSAGGELGSNQKRGEIQPAALGRDNLRKESAKAILSSSNSLLLTVEPSPSIPSWEDIKPLAVASSSVFLRSAVLQIALSGAAAMAARGGEGLDVVSASGAATASVAAHQIALQLWLLCSFVCDALAAASQALVADALGREDIQDVQGVSKTVFAYSLGLGFILAAALQVGASSNFLLDVFTEDIPTRVALSNLLSLIILAQPLNAFVFAADGVLQGASEFPYQAKTMVLSVWIAVCSFIGLEYLGYGDTSTDTLLHVWKALIVLQLMRAATSLFKVVDKEGPIYLLGKQ